MLAQRLGKASLSALSWLCRAVSPLTTNLEAPDPALWSRIMPLADQHMLLPVLLPALNRHDSLTKDIPPEVMDGLAAFHDLNQGRNGLLREQMGNLTAALNKDGICPIWLKGATELLPADWARSGRMMADLDFWLPDPRERKVALATMNRLGYQIIPDTDDDAWAESHQYAGRIHDSWPAMVEPHRHVVDRGLATLIPDGEALDAVVWMDWDGMRIGRLGARHRLVHALVQSTVMAVPRFEASRTPLMKALDVVNRATADFDGRLPEDLTAHLSLPAWQGTVAPFLTMTESLFGLPSPLPRNRTALNRQELVTAFPRQAFLRQTIGRVFSRRFLERLTRPSTIPGVVRRYMDVFRTGRDTKG
ncbi:nucleotidyltransferase family protein [Rhodospirillum sp. A1_3_36]|uniref:nucleotidyltransferase family protein n=1 Tax=Rhodospirillum sp. A1_3_36 TaxID=3391666 RepID=UPI0039A4EE07